MEIQPIDDVSNEESYIQDLELEIETLRAELKNLNYKLNKPQIVEDINCCIAYKILHENFHKLINDITPF